jgi:GNAT superfamily N-acetyltransferase
LEVLNDQFSAPEPLGAEHDLGAFDSGVDALDEWLRNRALANEASGGSRTFVSLVDGRVAGYYSLAATSILHSVATSRTRRNMPDPVPAILIARLAVDRAWQGKGWGGDLLQDAVGRSVSAAGLIGVRTLLVHAISDAAKSFYERFGFRASPAEPMTLMITLEEVRRRIA